MLVGIGLLGVLTASVASFFIEQGGDDEKAALQQRLDKIDGMLVRILNERTEPGES